MAARRGSKRIQHPVRPALVLDSQLAHVAVPGPGNARRIRERQRRAVFEEQFHDTSDAYLFFVGEAFEPTGELVCALDFPCQMPEYAI